MLSEALDYELLHIPNAPPTQAKMVSALEDGERENEANWRLFWRWVVSEDGGDTWAFAGSCELRSENVAGVYTNHGTTPEPANYQRVWSHRSQNADLIRLRREMRL